MSFVKTFVSGNQGVFNASSLTPMQKLTLRFVVVGMVFYAMAAIEGMLMRIYAVEPISLIPPDQYFGILTAHPLVGIFGSTYLLSLGAFLFLVPFMMQKPLWSYRMASFTFWAITIGTLVFWLDGFLTHYAPLYTLYWPLPADTSQFEPWSGVIFVAGIAIIMIGTLAWVWNIFATILHTPKGEDYQPKWPLFRSAIGLTGFRNLLRGHNQDDELVPLGVAAVARGAVDAALNSFIILSAGILIIVFLAAAALGHSLETTIVDALLYKNTFWWGLDLIADGLVLIWVAGAWYILATLITGRRLFMANVARAALLVELVVSWTVWSHHLLSDQSQPAILKVVSGEMVTALELITQGLAFFITLATLWLARPLKMTNELKFLLGGLTGFGLGVASGILQADIGLNRILHNTQWIIGPHVHVAILVGLTMTLYAVVYKLFPILTNGAPWWSSRLVNIHFWFHLLGGIGMGAFMGMAGLSGMLRRTIYSEGEFQVYMILAGICGAMLLIALGAFLLNIVMTVGLKGAIGIFLPAKGDPKELLPPAPAE
ncbi:MAG: cbb3-type cytochrome c oxidase subunit I [Chloroflexota bacterium]|nr:cbb3-type cytochrome c oxidase subunit I [Chloroflexota bacterium]